MSRLPRTLSGQQVRKAVEKVGFTLSRQRGSHMILYRDDPRARVVIPDHKEIRIGTLQQILQDANLSVDDFLDLL